MAVPNKQEVGAQEPVAELYALPVQQVYPALGTSPGGLSQEEAASRLSARGPNGIEEVRKTPLIFRFPANFYQIFALLLWFSALLSFLSGSNELGYAIIAVIFINAIFSFMQEYQAEKAVEALKKLLLRAASFRNNSRLNPPSGPADRWHIIGDPTEAPLLVAALIGGFDYSAGLPEVPRVYEIPFHSRRK